MYISIFISRINEYFLNIMKERAQQNKAPKGHCTLSLSKSWL
jgi:hypothetical protein